MAIIENMERNDFMIAAGKGALSGAYLLHGEEEFLKIAMETLSQDEKCVDKMKHWKRVIKKERGEFIRTGCTIEITERQRSKTTE